MIRFPTLAEGEPMSVSASLFVTYLRCPAQALAQLKGVYGPESRPAFAGMLAHRIFARHITGGEIAQDRFEMACREEIGQAMNPKLGSLQLRPSELRGVIAEVGALYERFQRISTAGCRSVETELRVEVAAGVVLRGRIDAVFDDDRGLRLVDWKTGALGQAEEQLGFYAMLWALQHGELPSAVEAASVSSGERHTETPSITSVMATARHLARMIEVMRLGFVDGGSVARHGGPACRYCPLQSDCAEGIAALRVLTA